MAVRCRSHSNVQALSGRAFILTVIRLLTPEHSMSLQNSIGSDIIMQLDDVIQTTSPDRARMKEAMERSVRWLDRCITAHKYPEKQNLFCIIQGGLDLEMRRQCCEEMIKRDTPGIAIGGLSGGEAKVDFCKVYASRSKPLLSLTHIIYSVDTCTGLLPENKPRYVMGIVRVHDGRTGDDVLICTGISRRHCRCGRSRSGHVRLRMANKDSGKCLPLSSSPGLCQRFLVSIKEY